MLRRKAIVSHLGLHMVSKYIPLLVEECNNALISWKESKDLVEMSKATQNITFNIMMRIMLGDDVGEKMPSIELIDMESGEPITLPFFDAYSKFLGDCISVLKNPFFMIFPQLVKLGLD